MSEKNRFKMSEKCKKKCIVFSGHDKDLRFKIYVQIFI
jgi:hypothetical protein